MNENINLIELLKDCPKGTKFYTPLCGEVEFEIIEKDNFPIKLKSGKLWYTFTKEGYFSTMGTPECLLFPSKDQRDWSKYQRPFKDGDVITSKGGGIALFSHTQTHFECNNVVYYHCVFFPSQTFKLGLNYGIGCISDCRLATEEEKYKLFQAIKNNGYKWNNQAKKLEMLITPNFKVGDIIQNKDSYKVKITAIDEDGFYEYESLIAKGIGTITFKDQYDWELLEYQVGDHFIHPSDPELFVITEIRGYDNYKIQRLRGSSYVINKHNLHKYTKVNKWDSKWFKPFDKVLVRDRQYTTWIATLFSHISDSEEFPYVTTYTNTKYCIPYNFETEHLVGTNLEETEFYKN